MSAAAAIADLYRALKDNATTFKSTATELVTDAQNTVAQISAYTASPVAYTDPPRTLPTAEVTPQPPVMENVHYAIPGMPPLDGLDSITDKLTTPAPAITLPGKVFDPTVIQTEFQYEKPPGNLDGLQISPDYSLIGAEPAAPDLSQPRSFSAEPLSGDPPNAPGPAFATFDESLIPYYLDGLSLSAPELARLHEWFTDYAAQFPETDGKWLARLRAIIQQTAWSVPEADWHRLTWQQGAQEAQFARYQALRELDHAPSSIAGLPFGVRAYERLKIVNDTTKAQLETLAKTDQTLREREFEFLKFALAQAQQMVQVALSLKLQQVVWQQQALKVIMDGAEAAVDLSLGVVELKEKEFALIKRYNEFQLNRGTSTIEREKSKLESLRIALESEKLKTTYNENNIKAYQVAINLVGSRIKKYQIEIDYAVVQEEAKLLNLEALKIETQQYAANLQLFKFKQELMSVKTKEDRAYLEAEIKKYEAVLMDVRKYAANLKIKVANEKIKAAELQQEATIYNASLSGYLKEFEAISKTSDIAAKAIAAGAKAERMQPQVQAMQQEVEDARILQEKIFEVKDKTFAEMIKLKQHILRVETGKAKAKAMAQAAGVAGGISTQAFAGLNAVATDIFRETV